MEIIKSVGISAAFNGFIIFFVYGLLTTLAIGAFYGLDSELPNEMVATLEGPISIYTFGWLALFGLIALAAVTRFGKIECNFNINRPKRVFYFALPVCEAAIALGVVIGGTLLGVAVCAHLLFACSFTSVAIYPQFYGLSAFMFLITYPVAYFTIALIDTNKTTFFWINATAIIYTVFIASTFY
ncbi:hypothetical protein GCM10027398_13520 [Azotobacter salinestris]